MYNITNIRSLGTDYTVADLDGEFIRKIQIITHTEILDAALGEYDAESFGSFDEYLAKSITVLDGFDDHGMTKTLWHATTDEEVILSDVIQYAINYDYERIILEHLEPTE